MAHLAMQPPRDAVRLLLLVLRFRVDTAGEVRRRAWSVNPTLSDKHIKQLLRALPAQSSFSCSPHGMLGMCVHHCVCAGALSVACTLCSPQARLKTQQCREPIGMEHWTGTMMAGGVAYCRLDMGNCNDFA